MPDPKERNFFENLATSYQLQDEVVDRRTTARGRLLQESPEYQRLLHGSTLTPRSPHPRPTFNTLDIFT
jgi:hypothetical protein